MASQSEEEEELEELEEAWHAQKGLNGANFKPVSQPVTTMNIAFKIGTSIISTDMKIMLHQYKKKGQKKNSVAAHYHHEHCLKRRGRLNMLRNTRILLCPSPLLGRGPGSDRGSKMQTVVWPAASLLAPCPLPRNLQNDPRLKTSQCFVHQLYLVAARDVREATRCELSSGLRLGRLRLALCLEMCKTIPGKQVLPRSLQCSAINAA